LVTLRFNKLAEEPLTINFFQFGIILLLRLVAL